MTNQTPASSAEVSSDERIDVWNDAIDAAVRHLDARIEMWRPSHLMRRKDRLLTRGVFGTLQQARAHIESLKFRDPAG